MKTVQNVQEMKILIIYKPLEITTYTVVLPLTQSSDTR